MITAGIDCGAKNTKSVILKNGKIRGKGSVLTGFDPAKAVDESLARAADDAGVYPNDIQSTAATGSGKNAVNIVHEPVNEIKAMARAARFYYPDAGTVVDVGAESSRAVNIDRRSSPVDFAVNDKCAAGAGAFIETMARALEVTLDEMGPLSLQSEEIIAINAQCVIFAESEVVGLIHSKIAKPDISRAIHDAVVSRIVAMMQRIGFNEDVVLIGGVGRNPGFAASMRRQLGLDGLCIPAEPEFGAAVGAAVVAAEQAGR